MKTKVMDTTILMMLVKWVLKATKWMYYFNPMKMIVCVCIYIYTYMRPIHFLLPFYKLSLLFANESLNYFYKC
jgi:hypothetical protein